MLIDDGCLDVLSTKIPFQRVIIISSKGKAHLIRCQKNPNHTILFSDSLLLGSDAQKRYGMHFFLHEYEVIVLVTATVYIVTSHLTIPRLIRNF